MLLDYHKSRKKRSDIPLRKNTTEVRRCVTEKREKTSDKQTSPDRAAVAYRMTYRTSGTTGKTRSKHTGPAKDLAGSARSFFSRKTGCRFTSDSRFFCFGVNGAGTQGGGSAAAGRRARTAPVCRRRRDRQRQGNWSSRRCRVHRERRCRR